MRTLQNGCKGQDVLLAQCALANAGVYNSNIDGNYGTGTAAAVQAFQRQQGLPPTGIVDAATAAALGLTDPPVVACSIATITAQDIAPMFESTPQVNIEANLPYILNALCEAKIGDSQMVLMALATIATEAPIFLPISEGISQYNTSPGGQPFDLYDNRQDLGNTGHPDGPMFRGRGFIQLTGRSNYTTHGANIGVPQLITQPTLAHQPDIAAKLLADFLLVHEDAIRAALNANNLKRARELVNGGTIGFDVFQTAYQKGCGIGCLVNI